MAEISAAANSDGTDTDSTSVVSVQSNVTRPKEKAEPSSTSTNTPKTIFSPLESQVVNFGHQQVGAMFGVKPVRPAKRTHDNTLYKGDTLLLYFITYMLFLKKYLLFLV